MTSYSLTDYIGDVKSLTADRSRRYAFRGEANSSWPLYPGIMRDRYRRLWREERRATRDLISVHPSEFLDDQSMFDRLVRMQHFGLPTRLLDVTINPLVALFNATEPHIDENNVSTNVRVYRFSIPQHYEKYFDSDTVSCLSNLSNMSEDECNYIHANHNSPYEDFNNTEKHKPVDRLVQFIRSEKPSFRAQIDGRELTDVWYVIPKLSNRRIIAQSGAFLIYGLCRDPKRYLHPNGIAHRETIIPESEKSNIRNELASLGITESTLFPEIDKAADLIRRKYS